MEAGWNEEPCRCPRLRCARNGYRESGFADKSGHADAIDLWRVAISDVGLPDRLLANADTAGKEKHRRGAYWNHPVIGSRVTACRAGWIRPVGERFQLRLLDGHRFASSFPPAFARRALVLWECVGITGLDFGDLIVRQFGEFVLPAAFR
jgi:hypothetical protein